MCIYYILIKYLTTTGIVKEPAVALRGHFSALITWIVLNINNTGKLFTYYNHGSFA